MDNERDSVSIEIPISVTQTITDNRHLSKIDPCSYSNLRD